MAKKETCVLTNMCMITDGDRVLVQDRLDPNWPGITFPGGHVEPGESFVASAVREVKEETGLDIRDVQLCGIKQWTQENGEYRYIVLLFKSDSFSGTLQDSREGKVFWIPKSELHNYTLAHGFAEMFEVFDNDSLTENYAWLENGQWLTRNI